MTARVLRPVITLTTVMVILVAAIAAYAFLTAGTTHATSTYKPVTGVKFCNDLSATFADPALIGGGGTCTEGAGLIVSAHPDTTNQLDYVSGDLNFSAVVTLAPNAQTIAGGGAIPVGTKIGGLHSETRLGTMNGPCNVLFPVDFVFYNVALPNQLGAGGRVDTSTNIVYPYPDGTSVRFGAWKLGSEPDPNTPSQSHSGTSVTSAGGETTEGQTGALALIAPGDSAPFRYYPHHLIRSFDTSVVPNDGDGPDSLKPLAVYGGLSKVAGSEWVPLFFAQFASGALSGMASSLSTLTPAEGQPSVSILTDPTSTAVSPSTITDFCTPLHVTTMLKGDTGAGFRITNPAAAGTIYQEQYSASLRDTDQDSYENAVDTCPLNVNAGNPRVALSGDADNDGIDSSCDPNDGLDENTGDFDLDGFKNRQDICPLIANPVQVEAELTTGAAADNGPRTDSMGNECDSEGGTKTFTQNGASVTITMSDSVGNGRYMTVTNTNTKCIEASLPIDQDQDGDGYCRAQDTSTDGTVPSATPDPCTSTAPPSCFVRHNQWSSSGPASGGGDTDGDKQSDALETYVGTDPVQSCSANTATNSEPMDNWMFDLNDDQLISGGDTGPFGGATGSFGKNVNQGPFGAQVRPGVRFDFNSDGIISGSDTGKFGGVGPYGGTGPYNKTCVTAGIPAFSQQ